jgi:hypothetical protein
VAAATLYVTLNARTGANYKGQVVQRYGTGDARAADMTATVSGDGNDIVIRVPSWGIEYRGNVLESLGEMVLLQRGGAEDGATWRLWMYPYSS